MSEQVCGGVQFVMQGGGVSQVATECSRKKSSIEVSGGDDPTGNPGRRPVVAEASIGMLMGRCQDPLWTSSVMPLM